MDEIANIWYFRWQVPDKGYTWDQDAVPLASVAWPDDRGPAPLAFQAEFSPKGSPPFLVINPDTERLRIYDPFDKRTFSPPEKPDEQDLFLKFIKTDLSEAGILQFANKYGWLGIGDPLANRPLEHGEGLNVWKNAISQMAPLIDVWKWVGQKEECKLEKIVQWSDDRKSVTIEHGGILAVRKEAYPGIFAEWPPGDVYGPAKLFLLLSVNKQLKGVSPALLFERGRLSEFWRPDNLLSALWLQFFNAITGKNQYRSCAICHELMDVTGARPDKVVHVRCREREKKRKRKG
ncbi:MAG: hypothetical protein ACYC55_02960 [Candidatus Geothermincolia bacterium]